MKKLLVLVLVTAAAVSVWKLRSHHEATTKSDADLVVNRIWLDHLPRSDKDVINVFAAITEEPFGVFQATSAWKGSFELFRYEGHGEELRIIYPQTNEREKVRARARRCSEHDMDYCLELDGASRGVKRYYSRKGWEIDATAGPEQVREQIDAIEHAH
jgi:hypothetical protein